MADEREYSFTVEVVRELYYSDATSYGVYSFKTPDEMPELEKQISIGRNIDWGEEHTDTIYNGILSGRMQRLYEGDKYDVVAKLVFSKKYNKYQYEPIRINSAALKTAEEQESFLLSILTESQAKTLITAYPNIVEDIMDGKDNVDFDKLQGIGKITYDKIKEKVINNYVISDILSMLQPLGVTLNAIKKLTTHEPNAVLLKKELIENPYILTSIRGFGFKKVDALAIKLNPELKESDKRLKAFIRWFLTETGEGSGHTWVDKGVLEEEIINNVRECHKYLDECYRENGESDRPFLHIEGRKIGLQKYYDMEYKIIEKLNEISNQNPLSVSEENIKNGITKAEQEQGYSLTEEQMAIAMDSLNSNAVTICGKAGCVDCDTEYFNGTEWKKISEFTEGERVLQYNENGTAELVYPCNYIKQKSDYLWHFETKYGLDQCLSDNHNCYWVSQKGTPHLQSFKEIRELQQNHEYGFRGRFLTSFNYNGNGIDLTDDQIRIMIATFADGSFNSQKCSDKTYNKARFHLKKDRKKKRLIELCVKCGCDYSISSSSAEGYMDIYIQVPFRCKHFPKEWYNCNQEQLKIIAEEIIYWDGDYKKKNRFSTTSKKDADFIQFVLSAIGKRATININDRSGQLYNTNDKTYQRKSIEYVVSWSDNKYVGMCADKRSTHSKTEIVPYKTKDGYEYCFTVPSHLLVLRRNNKIFITGNCGKTSIARTILNIYKEANCSIACCALSAKAVKVIEESTGFQANTIHRLLGSNGLNKFTYNENNPLPYSVLLIDEGSMNSTEIFYHLLCAVRPTTKIIICGDNRQLPPIGYGNTFNDIVLNNVIKTFTLTKVLRQAEKSGILSDANKIRDGINPIAKPELKIVTGELNDMTYMFRDDRDMINGIAIKSFMGAVKKYGVDDVLIGVPRKSNCTNCTASLNEKIQDLLLPNETRCIVYGTRKYKLGAKVIQRTNDYEKDVFNGDIGYIVDIFQEKEGNKMVNKFTIEFTSGKENKQVVYMQSEVDQIDLAYAMTIHSLQGSGYKAVIIIIDNTHYVLLDNCLLYTALTRAKEKCLLLAEPSAFKKCINTNKTVARQTWTKNILENFEKGLDK